MNVLNFSIVSIRLAAYKKHGTEEEAAAFAASTLGHIAKSMQECKIITPDATFSDPMTSLSEGGHPQGEDAQPWLPTADESLVFDTRYHWFKTSTILFCFVSFRFILVAYFYFILPYFILYYFMILLRPSHSYLLMTHHLQNLLFSSAD